MSPQVWLITGASSGLGRALAEHLLANGETVVVTLRQPTALLALSAQYPAAQLLVLPLDVSVPAQIVSAFAAAKRAFGRVDVVYNNAGYGVGGEVEGVPEAAARALFDTNFWGAVNVTKEAVRFFREENALGVGGRILIASSIVVPQPPPTLGHYTATKWAMSKELNPAWNIKLTLVQFGTFHTPGSENIPPCAALPAYAFAGSAVSEVRAAAGTYTHAGDPAKAARALVRLARLPDPSLRVPLGPDAVRISREQVKSLQEMVDAYAALSEDLLLGG